MRLHLVRPHRPRPERRRPPLRRLSLLLVTVLAMLASFAAIGLAPANAATPSQLGALQASVSRQLEQRLATAANTAATAPAPAADQGPGPAQPPSAVTDPAASTGSGNTTPAGGGAPASATDSQPGKTAATTTDPAMATDQPAATQAAPTTDTARTPGTTPGATTTPATDAAPTSSTGTTDAAPGDTYNVSAAAKVFLAGLNISLGDGPVTGTLTGTTLTVAVGTPALPLTLPVGNDAISFGGATLTIDEATDTLTLSATATTADGASGTLAVTIDHASSTTLTGTADSTDLAATVTLSALPILGTTVDLLGTLAYSGSKVTASITGTLDQDTVIAPNILTVAKGATVTLSTKDGATVSGSAVIGSGSTQFTVAVSGAISDEKNWNISVSDDTNAPSFTPVSGLTLTPAFSGTVTDTAGTVSFDVTGTNPVSWTPGDDVTLAVNHVEVSNQQPPSGVACPAGVKDGDVWLDVQGALTDTAAGLSANGEACIDATAQTYTLTGTGTGSFGPSDLGFTLNDPTVTVDGDAKAGTVNVSATATLAVTAASGTPKFPVTLAFSSDGSFTAGSTVDLSQLGLGSGSGTLLVASKEIKSFTSQPLGITDAIDLPAGVTVLLQYDPNSNNQVKQLFKALNVPAPAQIQAQASLSPSGFSIALTVPLGSDGVPLLPNAPGGFQISLDSLHLKIALTETSGSITIGGTALLQIPALYQGSSASSVNLTLNGSLVLSDDAVKINAGFDLDAPGGTWHDAFGIPGLSIGELAAKIGIEEQPEDAGIPLPTLSFTVNDVVLPTEWANAIGQVPGAAVSADLDLDADNPILSFAISPGAGQGVALEPLRIANDFTTATHTTPLPDSVVSALQIQDASLLFAPTGGIDAAGYTVAPGASLVFDAVIGGKSVHIDGSVGVSPYPHLTANVAVPTFGIGPVNFTGTTLAIDLEADPAAPKVDFAFHGGFTDAYTGIQFGAYIDLGASLSAVNATVTLNIAGGQPSYIAGAAGLTGSVSSEQNGLAFSASGNAVAYVGGQYVGAIPFSYSTDTGAIFAKLTALGNQVAYWFRNVYGESDTQVASLLNQIGIGAQQIAATLQSVFSDSDTAVAAALGKINVSATQIAGILRAVYGDGDVAVAAALNSAGQYISNTAYAVRVAFNETDTQVAAALNQAGIGPNQIAQALQGAFGDSQAAVYNALQQIGDGGQSVLDSIAGFFNTGSYWIYSNPWWSVPLFVDDSGGSQAPGNGIIQYTWTGGHNQDWYVLPTDSGYAEIVNRNSGQCLSAFGNPGDQVVQYPCYGWAQQQWDLGVYPGQNLNYTGHNVTNRATGWDLDVYGASTSAGTGLDTYYGNGGWNQWFTFEPAIG